jgi:hypothetical protein
MVPLGMPLSETLALRLARIGTVSLGSRGFGEEPFGIGAARSGSCLRSAGSDGLSVLDKAVQTKRRCGTDCRLESTAPRWGWNRQPRTAG